MELLIETRWVTPLVVFGGLNQVQLFSLMLLNESTSLGAGLPKCFDSAQRLLPQCGQGLAQRSTDWEPFRIDQISCPNDELRQSFKSDNPKLAQSCDGLFPPLLVIVCDRQAYTGGSDPKIRT